MAKQMTAAHGPLSAVAINRDIAETIEAHSGRIGAFGHGFTYGGHPVGCALGVKAIEIRGRMDAPARVRAWAPRFRGHIERLARRPLVGEGRAPGLIGALELAAEKSPRGFAEPGKVGPRAAMELAARGVISRAIGDTLAFRPPMILTEDGIDEMFAPVEAAFDATLDRARAEGRLG